MTSDHYARLRLRACDLVRELGACLDNLSTADEIRRLRSADAAADAVALHECFADALTTIDGVCEHAAVLREELAQLERRADQASTQAQQPTAMEAPAS